MPPGPSNHALFSLAGWLLFKENEITEFCGHRSLTPYLQWQGRIGISPFLG